MHAIMLTICYLTARIFNENLSLVIPKTVTALDEELFPLQDTGHRIISVEFVPLASFCSQLKTGP